MWIFSLRWVFFKGCCKSRWTKSCVMLTCKQTNGSIAGMINCCRTRGAAVSAVESLMCLLPYKYNCAHIHFKALCIRYQQAYSCYSQHSRTCKMRPTSYSLGCCWLDVGGVLTFPVVKIVGRTGEGRSILQKFWF